MSQAEADRILSYAAAKKLPFDELYGAYLEQCRAFLGETSLMSFGAIEQLLEQKRLQRDVDVSSTPYC